MDAVAYLAAAAAAVEAELAAWLSSTDVLPGVLAEAVGYAMFPGGKRIRPALVIGGAEACGGAREAVLPTACAFELVHTYSLVHDDLPALDDDDYRRGKPCLHKVYGEAVAILAGDALLAWAFELIAANAGRGGVGAERVVRVVRELARAAGPWGMAGGQVLDICARGAAVDGAQLEKIHRLKTGALFRAAAVSGGILAGGKEPDLTALGEYGESLGLAFQIADDVSDVARRAGEPSYAALYGVENCRRMAAQAVETAGRAAGRLGPPAAHLIAIGELVLQSVDRACGTV